MPSPVVLRCPQYGHFRFHRGYNQLLFIRCINNLNRHAAVFLVKIFTCVAIKYLLFILNTFSLLLTIYASYNIYYTTNMLVFQVLCYLLYEFSIYSIYRSVLVLRKAPSASYHSYLFLNTLSTHFIAISSQGYFI